MSRELFRLSEDPRIERKIRVRFSILQNIETFIISRKKPDLPQSFDGFVNEAVSFYLKHLYTQYGGQPVKKTNELNK